MREELGTGWIHSDPYNPGEKLLVVYNLTKKKWELYTILEYDYTNPWRYSS